MKKFFCGLGNVLWLLIFGLWLTIVYCALGVVFCVTIIGIPFGLRYFKAIPLVIWPIGKVKTSNFDSYPKLNTLFLLFGGFEFGIGYLLVGFVLLITVIGIPFGLQFIKLSKYFACPFGAEIRKKEEVAQGYSFYGNNIK